MSQAELFLDKNGLDPMKADMLEKYNRKFLITDGVLFYASRALFDHNVLVPAFISHLGASSLLIGLAAGINRLGFFLPQIFVANHASAKALNKPLLLLGVKTYAFALIALIPLVLFLSTTAPLAALVLFYIFYTIACFGDGIQALPWVDILAKTIGPTRRGRMLGYMQTLAGVASFGMAAFVSWVLTRAWLSFPVNYVLLIITAALLGLGSLKALNQIMEPARENPAPRQTIRDYLRCIPKVVRNNPGLKRFLLVRSLSQSFAMAAPFYVTYAINILGAPEALIGGFIAAQVTGFIAGGFLLGYLGDLTGNSMSVRFSILISLLSPLMGLLYGAIFADGGFAGAAYIYYLFIYIFLGATLAGLWMSLQNYLLDLVDPDSRSTCVGLSSMIVAPMSFLPMLGGFLIAFINYKGLFAVTLLMTMIGLWFSLRMREPRKDGPGCS